MNDPLIGGMTIELPPPISVNKIRKIDWRSHKQVSDWVVMADRFLLFAKSRKEIRFDKIERYELRIILSEEHVKIDADNGVKLLIDYLRHRDVLANDAKKNLRKFSVEWGYAPAGVKITIIPLPTTMKQVLERVEASA